MGRWTATFRRDVSQQCDQAEQHQHEGQPIGRWTHLLGRRREVGLGKVAANIRTVPASRVHCRRPAGLLEKQPLERPPRGREAAERPDGSGIAASVGRQPPSRQKATVNAKIPLQAQCRFEARDAISSPSTRPIQPARVRKLSEGRLAARNPAALDTMSQARRH